MNQIPMKSLTHTTNDGEIREAVEMVDNKYYRAKRFRQIFFSQNFKFWRSNGQFLPKNVVTETFLEE